MAGYAEELSDVLHFMVELLIYSNIGVKEVEEYYQKKAPELFINATSSCFNYSKSKMAYNREYTAIKFQSYRVLTVMEAKDDVKDDYPGNFISPEVFFIMRSLSYDLVESLKMASHKLKMKYWKQEDVYTSAFDFQNQIMDSFEKLFDYLVFVGMSEKRLYLSYEAKNLKNQQRLKDGY